MKFTLAALLVGIVSAAPAELQKRADATCGNTHYSSGQVSDAAQASCKHVKAGDHAGSSTYPHQYKNYEGFEFQGLSGPFYEFPIRTSGIYTGGSPGADRVIITSSCQTAGVITHQGASGNNFVACEGGSTGSDEDEESLGFAVGASDMSAARVALGLGSVVLMYVL